MAFGISSSPASKRPRLLLGSNSNGNTKFENEKNGYHHENGNGRFVTFQNSNSSSTTPKNRLVQISNGNNNQLSQIQRHIASNSGALPPQMQEIRRIQAERQNLPVYSVKDEIMRELKKNSTTILIGETGSGKTTQIPQLVLAEEMHKGGIIGVTQPRRVAAVSLAMRVSKEMGVELGNEVGYSVRFDALFSDWTKILYQTDGMLLREAILDPKLRRYSVIILDEAHERTLHTDVLFAVVKDAQAVRKKLNMTPLMLIIMSASMDVDHFSTYFNDAPVVYVEGRQHPIKLFYNSQTSSDYVHDSIVSIFQMHRTHPVDHGILVFLTGQEEIEQVVRKCREVVKECASLWEHGMMVMALYAAQSPEMQMRVFKDCENQRKVIVATNIAETSITISGIRIIIDSGKVKSKIYEPSKGIDMLRVGSVSKAQACQRTGRAGREAPGVCYRLYPEETYETFSDFTMPEIQRCNVSSIILELLAMGIPNVKEFDFMDKPKSEAIDAAIRELTNLGAITESQSSATSSASVSTNLVLTPLGKKMAGFALDPKLSRILLASTEVNPACTAEILTIVAIMSTDTFLANIGDVKKFDAENARRKFFAPEGDLITLLSMYRALQRVKSENKANILKEWYIDHHIQVRQISMVEKIREQLKESCVRLRIPVEKSCGLDKQAARRAICCGLFMNAAELMPGGDGYRIFESNSKAMIHPSSFLFQHKPRFVVFSELVYTTQLYMRDVTAVDGEFLLDAAPEYFKSKLDKS